MGYIIVGVILLVLAVILFFVGRAQMAKSTSMAATETSTAQLVHTIHSRVVGSLGSEALAERCEVKGIIECDEPLHSPLSEAPCVAFRYTIRREYEETITETDAEGNRTTSTRSGSETVESQDKRARFWVRDDTGRVLVDPAGADLDLQKSGERYESAEEDSSGGRGRQTLGYTHNEHSLKVGSPVYVLGFAVDFQGQPMVARHPGGKKEKFLISWRGEQELIQSAEGGSRNATIAAGVFGVAGVVLLVLACVL